MSNGMMPVPFGSDVFYLGCCPYALMKSLDALEVSNAHKWFDKCSFFNRFPEAPIGLVKAVEAFDMALVYCENERIKKADKQNR